MVIVAIALYDDDVQTLYDAGVSSSFNLYGEAGYGLATHACDILNFDIVSGKQPVPDPNFLQVLNCMCLNQRSFNCIYEYSLNFPNSCNYFKKDIHYLASIPYPFLEIKIFYVLEAV